MRNIPVKVMVVVFAGTNLLTFPYIYYTATQNQLQADTSDDHLVDRGVGNITGALGGDNSAPGKRVPLLEKASFILDQTSTEQKISVSSTQTFDLIHDKTSKQQAISKPPLYELTTINADGVTAEDHIILNEIHELTAGGDNNVDNCPSPLMIFSNVLKPSAFSNNRQGSPIPQILHVSMKSRCLPRDLAKHMKQWQKKLPSTSIFFHDDDAVERLIQQDRPEFPLLHTFMQCVQYKGAMKVDIWRLLILYKYGGIYTDIDNWPTESFDENWFYHGDKTTTAFFFCDANGRPSQWFMAVEPKHPIIYHSIVIALKNIAAMVNIGRPSVVQVTGPEALKYGYSVFFPDEERKNIFSYDGGNFTGIINSKKVRKFSKAETDLAIQVAYNFNEIVPFNSTLNVTRRERIEMESGVVHWDNHIHRSFKSGYGFRGSCIKYLAHLDKGSQLPLPPSLKISTGKAKENQVLQNLLMLTGGHKVHSDNLLSCPQNLHRLVEVLKPSLNHTIPLILHVNMESRCLPRDLADTLKAWQEALPNASVFFHDNEAVERLFQHNWPEFPHLSTALQCFIDNESMKVDVWRLLVLYQYGGIYVDIKEVWPNHYFSEAWLTDPTISSFFFTTQTNETAPWFIAIEPRHPMIYITLLHVFENIIKIPDLGAVDITTVTGSEAFAYGYKKFFHHEMDEKNMLFLSDETNYTGLFTKKVRKMSLQDTSKAIDKGHGSEDMVPYTNKFNQTLLIPRRERIKYDSDALRHWLKMKHQQDSIKLGKSCASYLRDIER